jgi:hypothetical protein
MAQPVTAKDVIIAFQKNDEYFAFACAESVELNSKMTTKSVKTIGDGIWKKTRGQSLEYTINLSGVVKFDDDTVPHAFDLYAYHRAMTHINYRLIFTNDEGTLKVIEGIALPIDVNLGGGSEGFANGSFVLEGDGAVDVRDLIIPCPVEILTVQHVQDGTSSLIRITDHVGSPARYDYSVDGGGLETQFATSFIQDLPIEDGLDPGEHTITIIPVCQNGYNGEPFTTTFTIMATGGESCDPPTGLIFTDVEETTATASWTAPGTPPGDGYYWELYLGASFVQAFTTSSTSVNLAGLTGGLTYTFKVKSICETGVSEGSFIQDTFETDASTDPTQIQWQFNETGGAIGSFGIEVNGSNAAGAIEPDNDTLIIAGGDEIVLLVAGGGSFIKSLFVQDFTTGIVLYSDSGTTTQSFSFTAVANHIYEVVATVTE